MFDANGFQLARAADGSWTASDCGWSKTRKDMAQLGDVVRLHGQLYKDARRRMHASRQWQGSVDDGNDPGPACKAPRAITGPRAHELDALLATRDRVRAIPPSFVRAQVLGEDTANDSLTDEDKARVTDLAQILAQNMSMYIEWPHIDGAFTHLYATLPGRTTWHWYDGDPEKLEAAREQ
jgi:hypothetical protein